MFFHNKAPRGGKEATELGPTKSGVVSGRESKLTVVTCRNNCVSSESTESTFETTESLLLSVVPVPHPLGPPQSQTHPGAHALTLHSLVLTPYC